MPYVGREDIKAPSIVALLSLLKDDAVADQSSIEQDKLQVIRSKAKRAEGE